MITTDDSKTTFDVPENGTEHDGKQATRERLRERRDSLLEDDQFAGREATFHLLKMENAGLEEPLSNPEISEICREVKYKRGLVSKEDTREFLTGRAERYRREDYSPDRIRNALVNLNRESCEEEVSRDVIDGIVSGLKLRNDHGGNLYPTTNTGTELLSKQFAAVSWAVPGILPEGVTIFAGKSKMGKSWLALGLCISVAAGGYALGKTPVERGQSLYLALRDDERRLRDRLRTVLAGEEAPDGFHYSTSWPKIGDGGAEALDAWLRDHSWSRLVVIDTLKKVRPKAYGNRNIYDVDYEALEPLLPIASKHNVSILVVHHTNKQADPADPFDVIPGSTGLTEGVDNVLILNRERGKKADTFLYVDGRDIEEQGELPLKWD